MKGPKLNITGTTSCVEFASEPSKAQAVEEQFTDSRPSADALDGGPQPPLCEENNVMLPTLPMDASPIFMQSN